MEKEKQRFMIYISPELLARLKRLAQRHKRSATSEIIYALEHYVEQQEREGQSDAPRL